MSELEKITVNISAVDLGKIDLLVEEGFFASRTDFVRTAIRNQLSRQQQSLEQTVLRRAMVLGVLHYDRSQLEQLQKKGERVDARVLGVLVIGDDVSPELAVETFSSIKVLGSFRASNAVKQALADRIQ